MSEQLLYITRNGERNNFHSPSAVKIFIKLCYRREIHVIPIEETTLDHKKKIIKRTFIKFKKIGNAEQRGVG